MQSSGHQSQLLVEILKEQGGRLGNLNARRLLSEKLHREVKPEDYERIKERLLAQGLIKKAPGRGGSIELLPGAFESRAPQESKVDEMPGSQDERVETLFTSLSAIPGLRVKKNRSTITVLCGEDSDKLYCGWAPKKSVYFVSYKHEAGKEDCSELAADIFKRASEGISYASVERFLNTTSLYLCDNVAQINRVVRKLREDLEDKSLQNSPAKSEVPSRPRSESYFLEIATLIKFCIDNNLSWPLKNWRKTLGFDDVDDLIVIGRSPNWQKNTRREHVVPVSLIRDEARILAENGAPSHVIADFIRCHLYVVLISKEESDFLDRALDKGGMSLKTSMPESWIFGDDPLERLATAGITINSDAFSAPRPKWEPWRGPRLRDKIRGALNTPILKV